MRRGGRGRRRREGHASALRVAADLGEDEDWLSDVANEMEPEEGLIWVYGPGGEGVMAFSDDAIEELKELVALRKAHPGQLIMKPDQSSRAAQMRYRAPAIQVIKPSVLTAATAQPLFSFKVSPPCGSSAPRRKCGISVKGSWAWHHMGHRARNQ